MRLLDESYFTSKITERNFKLKNLNQNETDSPARLQVVVSRHFIWGLAGLLRVNICLVSKIGVRLHVCRPITSLPWGNGRMCLLHSARLKFPDSLFSNLNENCAGYRVIDC